MFFEGASLSERHDTMTFSRRKIVAAAAGLVGSLAGCSGGSDGGDGAEETDTATATATATETPTATATSTPSGPPEDAPEFTINNENKTFIPMVAEVEPGTVVKWTTESLSSHSVTSMSPSSSESGRRAWNPEVASDWELDEDLGSEPVTHYFPEPGVYEYKCDYDFGHIGGCAAVVVGDQEYDQEMLPCEPQ
jgi:plastocyanin